MSGLVASRRLDSWWQRLALVTWMLVGGQLAASAADITTTFVSTNVGLRIPLQAGGGANAITESNLVVSGIQTGIKRISVSLYINHRWPADLRITLIPPGGDVDDGVLLLEENSVESALVANITPPPPLYPLGSFYSQSNRNSFNTGIGISNQPAGRVSFADDGVAINPASILHVNNVREQVHLLPNLYTPAEPLAAFNDMQPAQSNGTWKLHIVDEFEGADDGTLVYWNMTITEPGPHIWTGGSIVDDNWSTPENWQDGRVPTIGEPSSLLIFPLAAAGPSVNNIGDIRVVTMNVAGGYNFSATGAGSITLIANSRLTVNSNVNVDLIMPIELVGQPTITVTGAGGLDLPGVIDDDGAAAGLILAAGTSPLVISGTNTYTGVTAISSGVVDITNAAALGAVGGAGTTIASGASLRVAAGLNLANETVSVQGTGLGGIGSLVFTNGGVLNGLTLVAGVPGTISVLGGGVTVNTVTAAATPAFHSLSITNTGTITINGALPTTTTLTLNGGAATFGANQPNLTGLSLLGGADLNVGAFTTTVSGTISCGASADTSTISGTTISLGGASRTLSVADGAAAPDLTITAAFTTGSLNKSGAGTVLWNGSASTANLNISAGEVTGNGSVGNLSVGGAKFSPTGAFAVANLALGGDSWLLFSGSAINATGTVTIQGGILQPVSNGTVIGVPPASNAIGTFALYPGAPVNYTTGGDGNDVSFAGGGASASFTHNPLALSGAEGDGVQLPVEVTSTGAMTIAIVSAGGRLQAGGDYTLINNFAVNGATPIPMFILDDFLSEGTETGQLIIIPLTGGVSGNPNGIVPLTITDNDQDDTKTCGFGTGLTVFLLLGFALFFHLRLRRP